MGISVYFVVEILNKIGQVLIHFYFKANETLISNAGHNPSKGFCNSCDQ